MTITNHRNPTINVISAYAPTLDTTIKNPNITRTFYDKLSSVIQTFKSREALIIGGDFNAKTKAKPNTYPSNIVGKYAKSDININGEKLIEFCMLHKLKITNTFFKHKAIHLTTWESPVNVTNINDSKTNTPRRNPYRNQIDYILVKNNSNSRTLDSKATISKSTKSDHKPVIAKIIINWRYYLNPKTTTNRHFNVMNFDCVRTRDEYKNEINELVVKNGNNNIQPAEGNQAKWSRISDTLKQAATNTIGYVQKTGKVINTELQELSKLQRDLQLRIQSCQTEQARTYFKQFRNHILTEMHTILTLEENEKIRQSTRKLEQFQDNHRMYQAVKNIQKLKPHEHLLIKGENGLTADPSEQCEIIAKYFKNVFFKNKEQPLVTPPTPMTTHRSLLTKSLKLLEK